MSPWSVQRGLFRRIVSTILLMSLLLTLLPIPISPASVTQASTSTAAFPCQHRRCGCRTPEQCQKACCCSKSGALKVLAVKLAPCCRKSSAVDRSVAGAKKTESKSVAIVAAHATETTREPVPVPVLSVLAAGCHGQPSDWLLISFVGLVSVSELLADLTSSANAEPIPSEQIIRLGNAPDAPPPRLAAAFCLV